MGHPLAEQRALQNGRLSLDLIIITGGSKGFGSSLVSLTAGQGHQVISISRSAGPAPASVISVRQDLSQSQGLRENLDGALESLDLNQFRNLHLINNAAVVTPVGRVADFKASEIEEHFQINLQAPILLTQWFFRRFADFQGWKTVTNITSGAAFHPIEGWSMYCASKAGLRMFSETTALSPSAGKEKILNFSPGIMDTQMQSVIRSYSEEQFSRVQEFRKYKEQNQLRDPAQVAGVLLNLISSPEKIKKVNYDIKDFE